MPDISKHINVGDFPDNYQEFTEIVGMEKALELSKRFGGTAQYIPKLDDIHRKLRNNNIRGEFTGNNIPELSIKYGLTEVQVRTILKVRETSIEDFIKEEEE